MYVEGLIVKVSGEPPGLLVKEVRSVLKDGKYLLEVTHDVGEESLERLGVVAFGGDGEEVIVATGTDQFGAEVDDLVFEADEVGLLVTLVGEVGVGEEHSDLFVEILALAGIFEVEEDIINLGELLLEFLPLCFVGLEEEGEDAVVGGFEGEVRVTVMVRLAKALSQMADPEGAIELEVDASLRGDPDEVTTLHEDEDVGLAGMGWRIDSMVDGVFKVGECVVIIGIDEEGSKAMIGLGLPGGGSPCGIVLWSVLFGP